MTDTVKPPPPPPPPPPPITPGPPLLPKVRETPVPVGGLIPLVGLVAGIAWIVKRRGTHGLPR